MNSGRQVKNSPPVRASAIRQRKPHQPLPRPARLILTAMMLAVASLAPRTGRSSQAVTLVFPDTLDTPARRHVILPAMRPARKSVGLALSGGGANGFAQIGVLKALEEEQVPVDYIAGTSIGALVGGLYSSGYTAAELESIAGALPLKSLFTLDNDVPRANSYLEQKSIRDRASISIRFEGFRLVLPKSLSSAQSLTRTVDLLILNAPYHTTHDFADLPVSFRAVTTDLVSGRRVTLTSGPLSEAMRASSTIPVIYQPIERNGLRLADGGLVANLPVDELETAGAEYKIAVDTHGKMYKDGDDMDIPWKAADQAMTILTQVQYPVQLEHADMVISPDLDDHKATDISDIRHLIDIGYAKGKLLAPTIIRNLQVTHANDTDIRRFSKSIEGIGESPATIEQLRTARGIVRNATHLKAALRELLATDLFTKAHAEVDAKRRSVAFHITPLPQIRRVVVTGGPADAVSDKEVQEAFKPVIGRLYTNAMGTKALEQLVRFCRNRGYSLVEIEGTSVDEELLRVRLTPGRIESVGITRDRLLTRETPIRRELEIDTSTAFRLETAKRSVENLYGTGVFNRVSVSTESTDPVKGKQSNRMNFRLDEKPATVLRLGLRYDETSNAQVLLDFRNENLNGSANSLGGWAKVGKYNNRLNFEYSIPRIGTTPLTLSARAFYDQRDFETRQKLVTPATTQPPYAAGIQRAGVTAAFGTQIRTNGRLVADVTLQNAQAFARNPGIPYLPTENTSIASVGGRFTLDTRDNAYLPSDGRYTSIRYTSAYGVNDPQVSYWQLAGSHEENFGLSPATTLQISAIGGLSSPAIPFSERFFVGGMGNGYSYRFAGLQENDLIGNNIAVGGVQLRYKSPVQIIFPTSIIGLYNIGNVWQVRQRMSVKELVQGIGAGFVWETPLGPARLTASKAFAFQAEDVKDNADLDFSRLVIYFSLGHDF